MLWMTAITCTRKTRFSNWWSACWQRTWLSVSITSSSTTRFFRAYTPAKLELRPNLDLLLEIYRVLNRRIGLGHLGEATLGRDKTADGLQSLKWVKEGRLDLVKEYCQQDVRLTWDLYVYARDNGFLLYDDKKGHRLRVPLDLKLERFLGQS